MTEHGTRIDGVIFDLDGTLIDSLRPMLKMLNMAFERLRLPRVTWDEAVLAGRDGRFDWSQVLPPMDESRREAVTARIFDILKELRPGIMLKEASLISGVVPILEKISNQGMRIGLVTATPRAFLEQKLFHLRQAGVDHLFETFITSDDVKQRKPAPEPLFLCARRLEVPIETTVHIGDTCVDIQAGKAAGSKTIGVLTGLEDRDALAAEGPDAIVESVAQLEKTFLFDHAGNRKRRHPGGTD